MMLCQTPRGGTSPREGYEPSQSYEPTLGAFKPEKHMLRRVEEWWTME